MTSKALPTERLTKQCLDLMRIGIFTKNISCITLIAAVENTFPSLRYRLTDRKVKYRVVLLLKIKFFRPYDITRKLFLTFQLLATSKNINKKTEYLKLDYSFSIFTVLQFIFLYIANLLLHVCF